MGLYWIANPCALNQNYVQNGWNAQGIRKGLYSELFLVFFVYFISQALQTFVYKNTAQQPAEVRQPLRTQMMVQQDKRAQLPWHQKKWNRTFAIIFSNHCVAVGMVLLFNPFGGELAVAYIHFIFYILYIVMQLKLRTLPAKVMRIIMDFCNLALILIGTAGINYSTCNADTTCKKITLGFYLGSDMCFG